MTRQEEAILLIKGIVSELSPMEQDQFRELCEHLRHVIKQAGDVGVLALALIGSEEQAKP